MPSRLATLTRILLAVVLGLIVMLAGLADTAVASDREPNTSDLGALEKGIERAQEGGDRDDNGLVERPSSVSENEHPGWNQGRARLWPTGAHSPAVFRPPK